VPAAVAPRFDADSAWAALAAQVAFGPRVPGTDAHRRCGDWIEARLRAHGARVEVDTFTVRDREGRRWPLRNILARLGPEGRGRTLLVAHWDTRPWADQDPDSTRRDEPIPGANDGASGVAVLLEVARAVQDASLPVGVDLLFPDGEDIGAPGLPESYCQGTRRFAARGVGDYARAVVLDMVGHTDLRFDVELHSLRGAPDVVDWVWSRGEQLAPGVFSREPGAAIVDDHVPLLDAGLPAIDVIDTDFAAWHTHADDLSAVSPESLRRVGTVMLSLVLEP
jgi:hypothetical protein